MSRLHIVLLVLLGTAHGTRAQYEDYDDFDYTIQGYEEDYDYHEEDEEGPGGSEDFDGDGISDVEDGDFDNDGVPDDEDSDDDNDGIPDDEDPDDDNDGIPDELDDSFAGRSRHNVGGSPPTAYPQNRAFTPTCNNENCWIRVDWEPPPRDTWMSCLLGYRVGYR